ncbi:MAG: hypothetical protein ACQEQI_06640 [Bacillota bacterium]
MNSQEKLKNKIIKVKEKLRDEEYTAEPAHKLKEKLKTLIYNYNN